MKNWALSLIPGQTLEENSKNYRVWLASVLSILQVVLQTQHSPRQSSFAQKHVC